MRFAGFNYLVSTHVGLLSGRGGDDLYTHSQSWAFADIAQWMSSHPGTLRNVVFLLLVTSRALKSAFPFHSWLPRAHAAAPALMPGVIHKAGLYALLPRFHGVGEWMGWFLIAFSVTSAVIGGSIPSVSAI